VHAASNYFSSNGPPILEISSSPRQQTFGPPGGIITGGRKTFKKKKDREMKEMKDFKK
jgi:hypothetical protein